MSEETAPLKRPVGRPRKTPSINELQENQNNYIGTIEVASPDLSPDSDTGPENAPQNPLEAGAEEGFGMARSVGKKANDLIYGKNTFEMEESSDPTLNDGIELSDGDVVVSVLLREGYVESLRQEAAANGISLTTHTQRLMDWWVENEYALTPAIKV